jgi:hypothetical protein
MKRRAERTYFNTEYMPELYEDAIESNDPQDAERMTRHVDIIAEDNRRFGQVCRKFGWNFKEAMRKWKKEHGIKCMAREPFDV